MCFQISIFYKILKYVIFYILYRKNQNLYKYLETLETLETFAIFPIFYMVIWEIEKGNKLETSWKHWKQIWKQQSSNCVENKIPN